MKSLIGSLLGGVLNRAPVPYVAADAVGSVTGLLAPNDRGRHLQAMSSSGTVFAIVDRLATSTANVEWHMHRLKASASSVCPMCEKPGVALLTEHLALKTLNEPNDFYTRQELIESGQQHFDLTGETWVLVERDERMRNLPIGLWVVRPDRMEPVPSKEKFLLGYIYRSPDGQRIPLDLDEVMQIRRPDPEDPYRGLGAVQAAMRDVDSGRLAAEWNRQFFLNSAEPGGIIETTGALTDKEWLTLRTRWNEQHKGVSRAHRVAILEGHKWVDRKYTMKDMQFTELRILSRDMILEAYGLSKFGLGIVDDINRTTADALKAWFGEQMTLPRLGRWAQMLNHDFLPMFGSTANGVEFAHGNPVPIDREAANAERDSKTKSWATLVQANADPDDAAKIVGLPPIRMREPAPAVQPPPPVDTSTRARVRVPAWIAAAEDDADDEESDPVRRDVAAAESVDLAPVQEAWEAALEALLDDWRGVVSDQIDALIEQVEAAIVAGDMQALTQLEAPTEDAAALLAAAMLALSASAADQVVTEAAAQGVQTDPEVPPTGELTAPAAAVASLLAAQLATAAAREAVRLTAGGEDADAAAAIAEAVRRHLDSLTDAQARELLGNALTRAQNLARQATLRAAPEGALYASEVLDRNTCKPCREVHGRWLANISDMTQLELTYPTGGYVGCLGRFRCRGQVVGVWRPDQVEES